MAIGGCCGPDSVARKFSRKLSFFPPETSAKTTSTSWLGNSAKSKVLERRSPDSKKPGRLAELHCVCRQLIRCFSANAGQWLAPFSIVPPVHPTRPVQKRESDGRLSSKERLLATTSTEPHCRGWGRGFFRIWVLLSVVWIGGAIWIESNPPVQSGPPPPFDETLPYLKTVRGVKMDKLSDCEPAAKQDPRVDLQNCVEYFRDEQSQTMWRYVRWTAWAVVPPLALLFFGAAIGWALRGFRRVSEPI